MLGHALKCELIARNPADRTKPPRRVEYTATVWDEERVRLFLAKARRESVYYPLYLTAILTGMRVSCWGCDGRMLTSRSGRPTSADVLPVERQQARGTEDAAVLQGAEDQNETADRGSHQVVVAALRGVKEVQQEQKTMLEGDYHDHGLVFAQATGKPLHGDMVVRRDFRPLAAALGLPRCRFHDLRHVHVTHLAKAGVPIKVAMDRVGHSTVATTLGIYSHTLAGQDAAAARAVEALILGTGTTGDVH